MALNPHQKQQLLIGGGGLAAVVGYLWWRGQQQGSIQLAPLPPVSGGYINTDPGQATPTSQPVANSCPTGYYMAPGSNCIRGAPIIAPGQPLPPYSTLDLQPCGSNLACYFRFPTSYTLSPTGSGHYVGNY